jgi:hypothetical protein
MPPLPTPEEWVQIRHEYENTRRSIEDICLAYGISANTLRRRVKSWGWTMRQPPISDKGPPARAEPDALVEKEAPTPTLPCKSGGGSFNAEPLPQIGEPSPHIAEPPDTQPASERLQGAAARVMKAIEATSARLTAGIHLRETEMAARALGSLTRTLRELDELLAQHKALEPKKSVEELRQSLSRKLEAIIAERDPDPPPEDMDEFRNELARRLEAVIERHEAEIPAKYEAAWNEFAAEGKHN